MGKLFDFFDLAGRREIIYGDIMLLRLYKNKTLKTDYIFF